MRLVVSVDRDDDLGRKAGIDGPVVGRAEVLDAAMKLGTADPEDSDVNAIFASLKLLDELEKAGDTCEVVLLTGSPKVGVLSDRKVAEQFDQVLKEHPATSAFLVSDGAEDESLFPILASRVRIDGVYRVLVRQSASLESTYYTLTRALKDPKLRAKTVLPFALVLLILGIAAAGGVIWWGVIGLSILLGVYLIFWTFDIDEAIIDSLRSASTDIRQGSVAFGFGLFSMALVAGGFLEGYYAYVGHPADAQILRATGFVLAGLAWWLVGAEVFEGGHALRRYLNTGRWPRGFVTASTSIVGIGLVSYGTILLYEYLEGYAGPFQFALIVTLVAVGFAIVVGAGVMGQYLKARTEEPSAGGGTPS